MAKLGVDDIAFGIPTGGIYSGVKQGVDLAGGGDFGDDVRGALGEGAEDFFNAGKNRYVARPYEPNIADWGGQYGADDVAGVGFAGMRGSNVQMGNFYGQYNDPRDIQSFENQDLSDREAMSKGWDQAGALQLSREAAMGLAPSEAAYAMQSGLDRANAAQQSLVGSARGAAGIAQAQSQGAGLIAGQNAQAFNAAGQLRAQEMAQARGLYGQQAEQMRGQDLQRLQFGNQMSQYNTGLNDQWRLGAGNLGVQQGNQGLGYYQAAQNPYTQQSNLSLGVQNLKAQGAMSADAINAGVAQGNADLNRSNRDALIGAFSTGVQTAGGMGGSNPAAGR